MPYFLEYFTVTGTITFKGCQDVRSYNLSQGKNKTSAGSQHYCTRMRTVFLADIEYEICTYYIPSSSVLFCGYEAIMHGVTYGEIMMKL
jgi:hypothetical protein